MTIETKYNIGDEVWYANIFGEPFKSKVYGIVAEILGNLGLINLENASSVTYTITPNC